MNLPIPSRFLWTALLLTSPACAQAEGDPTSDPASFADYWFQGKAEVATYDLVQSRYGQQREGHAVLVFVTEPFRTDLQVKDEGERSPEHSTTVLKLNRIQRFTTGVYDYSLMQSVFTPLEPLGDLDTVRSLKTTTSVQDWCGHVWAQLNRRTEGARGYRLTGHSYFESEGDEERTLADGMLEDEIPTRLRIDPASLPTGEVDVIPGMFDARLRHRSLRVATAKAERVEGTLGDESAIYRLRYPSGRVVEFEYERGFPHGLLRFRETLDGGEVTEARRREVQQRAYWSENGKRFADLRPSLGLRAQDLGRVDERDG